MRDHQPRQVQPGRQVARIGGDAAGEGGLVGQAGGVFHGFDARAQGAVAIFLPCARRQRREFSAGPVDGVAVQQEADIGQPRNVGFRIRGNRVGKQGLGAVAVAGGGQFLRLGQRRPGLARRQPAQELAQPRLRQHAGELVHGLSVGDRHDMGDAAHAEMRGQFLVLVDIDLDQFPAAFSFRLQPFQHRAQRAARAAPGRPEIDQHRRLVRGVDHFGLEILQVDVAHEQSWKEAGIPLL
ncbi:hypothetical protein D9M69_449410 [compost metagenome]